MHRTTSILLLAALALGEETAEMDELSRKLIEGWEKKEYHLGRAGAERASFKFVAHLRLPERPVRNGECVATYRWDGKKGVCKYDDDKLGTILSQQGWGVEYLDTWFRKDGLAAVLAGCRLTATSDEESEETAVRIAGPNEVGISELRFDREGILIGLVTKGADGRGGTIRIRVQLTYEKEGGRYFLSGWTSSLRFQGGGEYEEKLTLHRKQVGGFHVFSKAVVTGTGGASKRIIFSDWKFNDEVE